MNTKITKNQLMQKVVEIIVEDINYGDISINNIEYLNDADEIHDIALAVKINGIKIEDDDDLYNQMRNLVNDEFASEVYYIIDDEVDGARVEEEQWQVYHSMIL